MVEGSSSSSAAESMGQLSNLELCLGRVPLVRPLPACLEKSPGVTFPSQCWL